MASATPSTTSLTPAGFQVLLALASGHTHGYAVMGFVEDVTDGAARLGPGTLYRTIARLVSDGLVVEADERDPDAPHDARRRYYALTAHGRQAAAAEAALLARLTEASGAADLLPEGSGPRCARSTASRPGESRPGESRPAGARPDESRPESRQTGPRPSEPRRRS